MGMRQLTGSFTRLFSDTEVDRIYQAAVKVLIQTGFRIQNAEILAQLEKHGARVDYGSQVFWPTKRMISALEDCASKSSTLLSPQAGEILRRPIPTGQRVVYNAPLFYDWPSGERRMSMFQDVVEILKTCHSLPEISQVGPVLAAQDLPSPIEPLVAVAEAIKITDKPLAAVELVLQGQLPFMEELETISQGKQVRYTSSGTSIDRFTIDARGAGMLLITLKRNGLKHWWVASCPTAGTTAPVTIAGAVVVGVAETLGGWLAGWAMQEDTTLGLSPCSSILDMRTTRVLFSAPEAVLIDAGQFQIFERIFGVRGQLLADYTDAKVPGMQAMNDKVFKCLAFEWLTNGDVNHHYGKLDAGKAFSPVQMLIDFEINRQVDHLRRGILVNDETLALDLIQELALNHSKSFLQSDHTLKHFRQAFWYPELMEQSTWENAEEERKKETILLEKAEARWQAALAGYQPPDIPTEKLTAVDRVIEKARKTLL